MRSWPTNYPSTILDALHEGVQVVDRDFRYVFVNPTAAHHGRKSIDELIGRRMSECYPGIDTTPMFGLLRRCLNDRSSHVVENAFLFPDGDLRWFELRIEPVPEGVCILSLDVTERKLAEAAVRANEAAQRRADHDREIRELVVGVARTIDLLISEDAATSSTSRTERVERTRATMDELRAYAQLAPSSAHAVDPVRILRSLQPRLSASGGFAVSYDLPEDGAMGEIDVDQGQLESALERLARFVARDVDGPAGVECSLHTVEIDADDARLDRDSNPGHHVVFSITKSGRAKTRHLSEEVFCPYSEAGREPEKEIGLAAVRGMIRQNRGFIRVESDHDVRTTFLVHLPRTRAITSAG